MQAIDADANRMSGVPPSGYDRRTDPETMHDGTMRAHVMQQMLQAEPPAAEREARAVRQEQRAERESMEGAVAEHHASTQHFPAALAGLGAQGAELMIEMPDRQLVGRVVHVGNELVSIVNIGGERFDLAMWAIAGVRVLNTERQPATVSSGHPNSVIARLREAVVSGEPLTVSRRFGAPVAGQLRACSDTHVEGVDHNKSFWIVPLPMVTWVASIRN